MRTTLTVLLVSATLVSACSTKLNPANWFGRSKSVRTVQAPAEVNPLIPTSTGLLGGGRRDEVEVYAGTPVEAISDLKVDQVPGGAIVRATGITLLQGVYDVRLTPVTEDEGPVNGVLVYRLEGVRDPEVRTQGTVASREVTAARKVTNQMLSGVRTIRVEGIQNARVSSR
ncbi:hypothetical protein AB1M95_07600 [Sulfitobacter sp. LCG007]